MGMYVWPSAPVLAQFIWKRRTQVHGKQILEIGAGTALPGIVAALLGGCVILSDSGSYPQCKANCIETCKANGLTDVQVLHLNWGRIDHTLLSLPKVDIILASDCFYDEKDFEDIVVMVAFIIEQNPTAEFWCTYQERSSDRNIEFLLNQWDLVCEQIPLSSFDAASPNIAESDLPGDHTIHMYKIKRR
ncbi:hypothetical protein FSP39_022818 [Pinctada imbricata]|uniref:Methyltransferase-like protein 23 n=1 Tax=Pinctada imbricata TaxID=66713 RepID=A0AA89BWE8_PINIB|nr:hypothetical protein FSP39_022818 [Pinctada imbricata]